MKALKLGDLPIVVGEIKPLQEQVLKHDICPHCHGKTLTERQQTTGGDLVWRQCLGCYAVWME